MVVDAFPNAAQQYVDSLHTVLFVSFESTAADVIRSLAIAFSALASFQSLLEVPVVDGSWSAHIPAVDLDLSDLLKSLESKKVETIAL